MRNDGPTPSTTCAVTVLFTDAAIPARVVDVTTGCTQATEVDFNFIDGSLPGKAVNEAGPFDGDAAAEVGPFGGDAGTD